MSVELIDHLPIFTPEECETSMRGWFPLCRRDSWKQGYVSLIPPVVGEGLSVKERTCVSVRNEFMWGLLPLSDSLAQAIRYMEGRAE